MRTLICVCACAFNLVLFPNLCAIFPSDILHTSDIKGGEGRGGERERGGWGGRGRKGNALDIKLEKTDAP